MSEPLLRVGDLRVRYGVIEAVRNVSFHVDRGEIVTLVGANGAGKTTTLSAIVSLAPVHAGSVVFAGQSIGQWPTERIVRSGMTLVPEGRQVFASLTVAENLRLGGAIVRDKALLDERSNEVFDLFPILAERRDQLAGTLSGGEQQQLAIGRALLSGPQLLLLDEPSLGLAPQVVESIFDLIGKLRDRGLTILLVEQNAVAALQVADRGYIMANGMVETSGVASDLANIDEIAAAYLGGETGQ